MSWHHAGDGKPEYVWEYEAFNWAVKFCKKKGIPVPQRTINHERNIIAEKLKEEVDEGTKRLDPAVVRFVKDGGDGDSDVEFVKNSIADDGKVLLSSN